MQASSVLCSCRRRAARFGDRSARILLTAIITAAPLSLGWFGRSSTARHRPRPARSTTASPRHGSQGPGGPGCRGRTRCDALAPRPQALPGNAMPAGSACIPSNALPGAGGGASPAVRSQAEPGNEGAPWERGGALSSGARPVSSHRPWTFSPARFPYGGFRPQNGRRRASGHEGPSRGNAIRASRNGLRSRDERNRSQPFPAKTLLAWPAAEEDSHRFRPTTEARVILACRRAVEHFSVSIAEAREPVLRLPTRRGATKASDCAVALASRS